MSDLATKNVLLTGAAGGIGRATALALARGGANLLLTDIETCSETLADQVRESEALGVRAETFVGDLTAEGKAEELFEFAIKTLGEIDILINNAGIEIPGSYLKYQWQEVESVIAINLLVPMKLTQLFLGHMQERGSGHVVNLSSLAGKSGTGFEVPYSTSKFGIYGFTQALRAEYAKTAINFSAICPIFVSGSGMVEPYERELGLTVSRALGSISAEDVAAAIVRAIDKNLAEVVVARLSVRAALKVSYILPRLMEKLGLEQQAAKLFKSAAEKKGRL